MMPTAVTLDSVGRIPFPGDNAAIASRRLDAGLEIRGQAHSFRLSHRVLEGHRFAIVPIPKGRALLSWGLPFGVALQDIAPGDYVCNRKILQALSQRHLDFPLPTSPNFSDHAIRYVLDERDFRPGTQISPLSPPPEFEGFERDPRRGVGTRNYVVILGTSSRTASFARSLAERFPQTTALFPNVDGVVPVAHTEGGDATRPNNFEFVVRTLAGFMVHPNVGAILAVDAGGEPVNNQVLQDYLKKHDYPIESVPAEFMTLGSDYESCLQKGEGIVRKSLEQANRSSRSRTSVARLRFALQCGGSDAFSGVSGNPLAGWMAKRLIQFGGSANLAESDELIGAEPYVLKNVKDVQTARRFLGTLQRFQERASWHGHDAEGNPSGGNNYRGLYNIAIKSIGAALKKDPEVCLDHVIDYGERMDSTGFYFMDSPGNDLESIAGQVAAGCNVILFTTGNGSITNFPFVPTLKIMTSTARFNLLSNEMDINAGRYQDGMSMDDLGAEAFDLALRVAAGQRTAGEHAGHSQVQIWREWRQTNSESLPAIRQRSRPSGQPIALGHRASNASITSQPSQAQPRFPVFETDRGCTSQRVGLIVPTSLCAGQVGRMIATQLNQSHAGSGLRYVALPHTEGCGASGGESEELFIRTMAGYLRHPFTERALLLEHGCEKTHNDAMRVDLERAGVDVRKFGWASIQLDGGITAVTAKALTWFNETSNSSAPPQLKEVGIEHLRLGLVISPDLPESLTSALVELVRSIVSSGGSVVIPHGISSHSTTTFFNSLLDSPSTPPSLDYGQAFEHPGLHLMHSPTSHPVEILTGLGATGVEVILCHADSSRLQGHPMIPVLQIGTRSAEACPSPHPGDYPDLWAPNPTDVSELVNALFERVAQVVSRTYRPKSWVTGNTDFQMTRGFLGVSL
jgi:altronate dehydratase